MKKIFFVVVEVERYAVAGQSIYEIQSSVIKSLEILFLGYVKRKSIGLGLFGTMLSTGIWNESPRMMNVCDEFRRRREASRGGEIDEKLSFGVEGNNL